MDEGNKRLQVDGQTFIIDIKNTQNNTWQGTVLWTQTRQQIPFRSALELIRLLNSAVDGEGAQDLEWKRS